MKASDGQRAVDYMREHMAMSDWETDQEQNWIASHMAQFAKFERRRIRRLIAPHLYMFDDASPLIPAIRRKEYISAIVAIDRATKAPRNARKGK